MALVLIEKRTPVLLGVQVSMAIRNEDRGSGLFFLLGVIRLNGSVKEPCGTGYTSMFAIFCSIDQHKPV